MAAKSKYKEGEMKLKTKAELYKQNASTSNKDILTQI